MKPFNNDYNKKRMRNAYKKYSLNNKTYEALKTDTFKKI